uniref:Uncharacterized protein n=1 Tax=Anguilla anguilla TaxID=7936 RepID=A0A0E9V593_ANGAN
MLTLLQSVVLDLMQSQCGPYSNRSPLDVNVYTYNWKPD